jgi:hypothetical protein
MAILETIGNGLMGVLVEWPLWARSLTGAAIGALLLGIVPPLFVKGESSKSPEGVCQIKNAAINGPVFQGNNTINISMAAPEKPNVIFAELYFFWSVGEFGYYSLHAVASLRNFDNAVYQVTGAKFENIKFKLVERSGVVSRTCTQSSTKAETTKEISIGPTAFARFDMILPIKVGLDAAGELPSDVILSGHWTLIIDGKPQRIAPSDYSVINWLFEPARAHDMIEPPRTLDVSLYFSSTHEFTED